MHTRLLIMFTRFVFRFAFLGRRLAWHVGYRLRMWGKTLMWMGEEEIRYAWGAILFARLPFAQLDIVDFFPKVYRGAILGASFCFSEHGAKKKVVLHLNWIAMSAHFCPPCATDAWVYGGLCDVVVDPAVSPIRELPDGTLWFMWPNGNYGVIKFNPATHLQFAGNPKTPRVYKYF